eukprot:294882_1
MYTRNDQALLLEIHRKIHCDTEPDEHSYLCDCEIPTYQEEEEFFTIDSSQLSETDKSKITGGYKNLVAHLSLVPVSKTTILDITNYLRECYSGLWDRFPSIVTNANTPSFIKMDAKTFKFKKNYQRDPLQIVIIPNFSTEELIMQRVGTVSAHIAYSNEYNEYHQQSYSAPMHHVSGVYMESNSVPYQINYEGNYGYSFQQNLVEMDAVYIILAVFVMAG